MNNKRRLLQAGATLMCLLLSSCSLLPMLPNFDSNNSSRNSSNTPSSGSSQNSNSNTTYSFSNISLVATTNNSYDLLIEGTCSEVDEGFKHWALSLYNYDNRSYVVGTSTPKSSDYIYSPIISENERTFTIAFPISQLLASKNLSGVFNIYTGPRGKFSYISQDTANFEGTVGNYRDSNYNYYFRSDTNAGGYLSICADELPPYFHLSDAVIEFKEDHTWVKIYGEAVDQSMPIADIQTMMDSVVPFLQFQVSTSGSNSWYQPENASSRATAGFIYNFKAELVNNTKIISLNARIDFLVDHVDYSYATVNTHLNLKSSTKQANCVMENDFSHIYGIPNYQRTIEVFSHPSGPNTFENAYGNLAIQVRDI